MKKTFKLLLALTLASSMLMSFCPISHAAPDPNLTYELDFSQLDTSSTGHYRGLTSTVTANASSLQYHYFNSTDTLTTTVLDGVTALDFNDKDGFLVRSYDDKLFGSKDITFEMWIYKKSTNDINCSLLTLNGTALQFYYLGAPDAEDKTQFMPFPNTREKYTFSDYHNLESWNHIVVTRTYDTDTSATTKLYSNGELKNTYTATGLPTFAVSKDLFVGSYDANKNLGTALASLKVYNKVLSDNEVKAKFNAEKDTYSGNIPKISAVTDTDTTAPDMLSDDITLSFNKDISTFTIGNENVTLTEKETGKKIATTVSSVDTTNKTVTVSLGQMLKPNKEYVVNFISDVQKPSAFDPQISFTTADYVEKATVTPTKETNNLKVVTEFNEASVGKTCCVLAVVYDETGRMVKTDGSMQKFVVASDNKICTLNINSTSFGAGYRVKVYAWNMSGLVPMQTISEPVLIEY